MSDELAAIRWELWDLLRAVRDEEIEPEAAETVISVLDSLLESVRLERLELALRRTTSASENNEPSVEGKTTTS